MLSKIKVSSPPSSLASARRAHPDDTDVPHLPSLQDTVPIFPMEFNLETHVAISSYLHKKYANKVLQQVGFCMAVWDLEECGDGKVRWGDGAVWYKGTFTRSTRCRVATSESLDEGWVECCRSVWRELTSSPVPSARSLFLAPSHPVVFRLLMFQPVIGEVFVGKVIDSTPDRIRGQSPVLHRPQPGPWRVPASSSSPCALVSVPMSSLARLLRRHLHSCIRAPDRRVHLVSQSLFQLPEHAPRVCRVRVRADHVHV